jgi:hypothetical protein
MTKVNNLPLYYKGIALNNISTLLLGSFLMLLLMTLIVVSPIMISVPIALANTGMSGDGGGDSSPSSSDSGKKGNSKESDGGGRGDSSPSSSDSGKKGNSKESDGGGRGDSSSSDSGKKGKPDNNNGDTTDSHDTAGTKNILEGLDAEPTDQTSNEPPIGQNDPLTSTVTDLCNTLTGQLILADEDCSQFQPGGEQPPTDQPPEVPTTGQLAQAAGGTLHGCTEGYLPGGFIITYLEHKAQGSDVPIPFTDYSVLYPKKPGIYELFRGTAQTVCGAIKMAAGAGIDCAAPLCALVPGGQLAVIPVAVVGNALILEGGLQTATGLVTAAGGVMSMSSNDDPTGTVQHDLYKQSLREQMGKPIVKDPDLKRLLDQQYRDAATVGSGSTAAAIRQEKVSGMPVGGAWHDQKGQNDLTALIRWLQKNQNNPDVSPGDKAAAENVIKDLREALGR